MASTDQPPPVVLNRSRQSEWGRRTFSASRTTFNRTTLQAPDSVERDRGRTRPSSFTIWSERFSTRIPGDAPSIQMPFFFDAATLSDTLPGDLALELSKGQQHVEREASHCWSSC